MTNRSSNSRSPNFGKFLERVLWFCSLAAVTAAAVSSLAPVVWQSWENYRFDHTGTAGGGADGQSTRPPEHGTRLPENALVGRVTIARLGIHTTVREGASARILSIAAGHIPGTSYPGEAGNVGIAAHRDTLFRALRHVRIADRIELETGGRIYVYQVDNVQIVEPTRTDVLEARGVPELTLVTCYPFDALGAAPKRFIVKARLVSQVRAAVLEHSRPQSKYLQ